MPKTLTAILLFFFAGSVAAQTDTGRWTGGGDYLPGQPITTVMNKMGASKKISLKIDSDGKVRGVLSAQYDKSKASLENTGVNQSFRIVGEYDVQKNVLLLILTGVIQDDEPHDILFRKPDTVYYSFVLQPQEDKIIMTAMANALMNRNATAEWIGSSQGFGMGMNVSDPIGMHLLPLRMKLERPPSARKQAITALPKAAARDTAASRRQVIQRTIYLDTGFIRIDLYDNGDVDGDIATLLLDGKPIIENQLLTTKAATVSLTLSPQPAEHVLELFALSLGSIPPNSALVVLTCNRKRYEINLSSTFTSSGSAKLVCLKK